MIDWGTLPGGVKVFCAVVAWCRFRFVRFARDETAATTMAMLAECFETIGGVPAKVLADRMGCLKGGMVANVVIPTPDYVRFATHYGFRPDFCHPADPESKGIVEHLVGYAKRDICRSRRRRRGRPGRVEPRPRQRGATRSTPPCTPRRAPSRPSGSTWSGRCCGRCRRCGHGSGGSRCARSTSCPRSGSRRCATRCRHRLVGRRVETVTFDGQVRIYDLDGELVAEHPQLAAG